MGSFCSQLTGEAALSKTEAPTPTSPSSTRGAHCHRLAAAMMFAEARENAVSRNSTTHGASASQLMATHGMPNTPPQVLETLTVSATATADARGQRAAEPPSDDWGRRLNTSTAGDECSACDSTELELSADVGVDGICAFLTEPPPHAPGSTSSSRRQHA